MPISIDFTRPVGNYPTEAMNWNTGNPFESWKFYPGTDGIPFLGRDHDCAETRYYIDGGLIVELEATAVNQAFDLFLAKPAGPLNEIRIVTVFDFVESLNREIRTSGGLRRHSLPFVGSVGVVANNADVPNGLSSAGKRIGATCALNYDPDAPETDPPSAPPSVERLRLNAPGAMYSDPRPSMGPLRARIRKLEVDFS